MSVEYPRVGVVVAVQRNNKILLAQRKNVMGDGKYAMPGGRLEPYESFADCARREVLEETGLNISDPQFLLVANITEFKEYPFICIGMVAKWQSGEAHNMEPEKSGEWEWFSLANLPTPTFASTALIVEALQTGRSFFDA
jgi:8-oxo-dGTP diphosphatase